MTARSQSNLKRAPMYASAVASIAANTTYSTPSDPVPAEGLDHISVELEFTGHAAGANGAVTFNLSLSTDYNKETGVGTWSTETLPVVCTLNGTTKVRSLPNWIDLRQGVRGIKVLSIVNGDAAQQVDGLNAYVSATQ